MRATRRLSDLRTELRQQALLGGISPRDVDLLICDALGLPLTKLISHDDQLVNQDALESITTQLHRRIQGEPLQYIRGRTEFFGRDFHVDSRALIPRPETELLVEAALRIAKQDARVLDVGTGTGCIAITLELERPDLRVFGSDRSLAALALARKNKNTLASQVRLLSAETLDGIRGLFDMIVANPPYIPAPEVPALATEVRDHEPRTALTPGETGLEAIEQLLSVREQLRAGGIMILEIGYGQDAAVRSLSEKKGWTLERVVDDWAAIPRVVVLRG